MLHSEWLTSWKNITADVIRDALWPLMDSNDRLLVVEISQAAWRRLMISDDDAKAIIES